MTSERQRAANRRNAQASTGPRTAAGKARVARNARRHGLNVAVADDPALTSEAEELAQAICRRFAGDKHTERFLPPSSLWGGVGGGGRRSGAPSRLSRAPSHPDPPPQGGREKGLGANFESSTSAQLPPAHLLFLARRIAEAQVDIMRVRRARHDLIALALANPDYRSTRNIRGRIALLAAAGKLIRRGLPVPPEMRDAIMVRPQGPAKFALILADMAAQLAVMARYERRALSRRNTAVRAFDAARAGIDTADRAGNYAGKDTGRGSSTILITIPTLGADPVPPRSASTLRRWRNKAKILRGDGPLAAPKPKVPPPPWGATPIGQVPVRQVVNYICQLLKMEPAYPSELPRDGPQGG